MTAVDKFYVLTEDEQKEIRLFLAWLTGGPQPDWEHIPQWLLRYRDLLEEYDRLKQEIQQHRALGQELLAERNQYRAHNALLRAVAEAARMVLSDVSDDKLRPAEIRTWVLAKTYKAAIDGGALGD